jgi:hypothetical protein
MQSLIADQINGEALTTQTPAMTPRPARLLFHEPWGVAALIPGCNSLRKSGVND